MLYATKATGVYEITQVSHNLVI